MQSQLDLVCNHWPHRLLPRDAPMVLYLQLKERVWTSTSSISQGQKVKSDTQCMEDSLRIADQQNLACMYNTYIHVKGKSLPFPAGVEASAWGVSGQYQTMSDLER